MKHLVVLLFAFILLNQLTGCKEAAQQGVYFEKNTYSPTPLPVYKDTKSLLPSPIYEENPLWVESYWKAWEIAFNNFYEPAPGSGFVSQFADAAFNESIFLWDMAFMTMFLNFAHPLVPGISGLDNFYAKQYPNGLMARELLRETGEEVWPNEDPDKFSLYSTYGWVNIPNRQQVTYVEREVPKPNPNLALDALNHPIAAWAEWESYLMTGDTDRLKIVWKPLDKYFKALKKYLTQGNGLYITDWASMDNSERNPYLAGGGNGIDISSEMVLFANNLADIFQVLSMEEKEAEYRREATQLSAIINELMWNEEKQFYFDLTLSGEQAPIKSIAAFWTLLAGIASQEQASGLVSSLTNPEKFWRQNLVPTLSAQEKKYSQLGEYWCGAVWAPTNTMVIRGLENYGYAEQAKEIAMNHLNLVAKIFEMTGTIWENYAPDTLSYGYYFGTERKVKGAFVGWSGIGPIMYLIEYAIGLKADGVNKVIQWDLSSKEKVGCERFRFGGIETSLVAESFDENTIRIFVESDGNYTLVLCNLATERLEIQKGQNEFFVATAK